MTNETHTIVLVPQYWMNTVKLNQLNIVHSLAHLDIEQTWIKRLLNATQVNIPHLIDILHSGEHSALIKDTE